MITAILKKVQLTTFLLFIFQIAYCQQKEMLFEKFDVENGLSSNLVRGIVQDKKGYIWLSTSDGLNRFDGNTFKVYQKNEEDHKSILVNYIRTIFVDNENLLWLGYNGGLSRYDDDKDAFTHFVNNPNNINSLVSNKVSDITNDTKGTLWIATKDKGICSLNKSNYQFQSYPNNDDIEINYQYDIHCDKKDRLWIGTYNAGIIQFDVTTKKYIPFTNKNDNMYGFCVTSIFEDRDGGIWAGTLRNGLFKYDEQLKKFIPITIIPNNHMIATIAQDKDGNIWVSSENVGLYIIDIKTNKIKLLSHNKFISNGIAHNSINSIIKDVNDNMWMGTFASGVNLYKANNNRFGHYFNNPLNSNSLSHNAVLTFAEDSDKNLWIGTDGGGLDKYSEKTKTFEHFIKSEKPGAIKSNVIISVYEDKRKNLWVGTYLEGLHLYNKKNNTFEQKMKGYSFGSIIEDNESNLWLGGWRDGLFLYKRETDTFKKFSQIENDPTSISDNFVYFVYEDKNNNIWVCTSVGLNKLEDKANGKFRRFLNDPGNKNSLPDNNIYHCYEDSKGRFWIGTSGGLSLMNRDSINFTTYKEKDGLINNNVFSILEDHAGNIWVSTNKGISCFNPETKKFKNYNKSDGLQGNQFSGKAQYKLSTGELLFGGTNGYNRFNPADITINKSIPPITIKDVQAYDNANTGIDGIKNDILNPNKEIILKYSQSNLLFDFVAFNYGNTKKIKYAYKLEGFDADWKYLDQPIPVNYTNLDPGHYIFKVKAANEDGIWNEKGTQIKVTINPPYWASWWFRGFILLVIAVIAYYIYRKNILLILRKHKILEDRVKEKSKLIMEHKEKIDALTMQLGNKNTQW